MLGTNFYQKKDFSPSTSSYVKISRKRKVWLVPCHKNEVYHAQILDYPQKTAAWAKHTTHRHRGHAGQNILTVWTLMDHWVLLTVNAINKNITKSSCIWTHNPQCGRSWDLSRWSLAAESMPQGWALRVHPSSVLPLPPRCGLHLSGTISSNQPFSPLT